MVADDPLIPSNRDDGQRYWLEAGTVLCFEKQPDKPFIPRRGESFTSQGVYKAEYVENIQAKLAAAEARIWNESAVITRAFSRDMFGDQHERLVGLGRQLLEQLAHEFEVKAKAAEPKEG